MTIRRSHIITLLTDFGNQDAYVGIMKGVIARINPLANIIDICHSIPPHDIFHGAYLMYTAYKYFPKGTIHVAVVDPGVGSTRDVVCVETQDFVFLAPNNGILSFIVKEEKVKGIFRVSNNKYFLPKLSNTFHGRDVFAPVAAHLSCGVKPQRLGTKIHHLEQFDIPKPSPKKGCLEGKIIYIDRFGNLITNIASGHIKYFNIDLKCMETSVGRKKIIGLSNTYMDVKAGKPLVLIGSAGFLEVSVNQGDAQKYFHVNRGSKIMIRSLQQNS